MGSISPTFEINTIRGTCVPLLAVTISYHSSFGYFRQLSSRKFRGNLTSLLITLFVAGTEPLIAWLKITATVAHRLWPVSMQEGRRVLSLQWIFAPWFLSSAAGKPAFITSRNSAPNPHGFAWIPVDHQAHRVSHNTSLLLGVQITLTWSRAPRVTLNIHP